MTTSQLSSSTTELPLQQPKSPRLLSLDVYRGIVILAMLIVNNMAADNAGYFWGHAEWVHPWLGEAFKQWWHGLTDHTLPWYAAFTQFPVWRQCTLADYVMPSFMLIIGLAIPYSVASTNAKDVSPRLIWFRVVKRAALLLLLGWVLCYTRDELGSWLHNPTARFHVSLGMDVLQLLGVAYLLARILYELPRWPRLVAAMGLLIWHWAFLRFWPQGDVPAGTFDVIWDPLRHHEIEHTAARYAYDHWRIFTSIDLLGWMNASWSNRLTMNWVGLLSVPPAAGTMLLGTLAGDWMRRSDITDAVKVSRLALFGALAAAVGLAWAFDLPFNKPRWTPCYLLWVSGVGLLLIAALYWLVDMKKSRRWIYPFVVLGANSLAVYWLSIMGKILFLNIPRITLDNGRPQSLGTHLIHLLKNHLGESLGGWMFTILFIIFWWIILDQMYRRKIFWRI